MYSDELMHYGIKRRSGRYPWGSGDNPYQHEARLILLQLWVFLEQTKRPDKLLGIQEVLELHS